MKPWENDSQYELVHLREVEELPKEWVFHFVEGMSLIVPKALGFEPKAGDEVRLYGRGPGFPVRGVVINGRASYYRTTNEEEARRQQWIKDLERESKERFEKHKPEMDADYEALPEPFKKRIDRFRAEKPDFRWESEGCEMFCLKQAVVIAEACKDEATIRRFHSLSWEEQRAMVPGLDDGHSGNTFGGACRLAIALVNNQEV